KPVPRYGARALGFLPENALPEVDEQLADNLLHVKNFEGFDEIVSLVVRYATPGVYRKIAKAVDAKPDSFGRQWSPKIFAYSLKINPTETEARLEKTLASLRNDDFGYDRDFFGTIARTYYHPVLEHVAIRHLNDSRINLVLAAVRMLGSYGSPAAE